MEAAAPVQMGPEMYVAPACPLPARHTLLISACPACLPCRGQLQLGLPDWDMPEFRQAHLGEYLGMTAEFMEEFADQLQ